MPPILIGFLFAIAGSLLVANVLASRRIVCDELAAPGQKTAQLLLVWLVPALGALFVFMLTRSNLAAGSGRYPRKREESDEDVDVAKIDYSSSD